MGAIVGIGTDIISIERISSALERFGDRFLDRVLATKERVVFSQRNSSVAYVAKRFAAKEAVLKALGTGLAKGVRLNEICVLNDRSGRPKVTFEGGTKRQLEQMDLGEMSISLSDEKEFALAFVVIESR